MAIAEAMLRPNLRKRHPHPYPLRPMLRKRSAWLNMLDVLFFVMAIFIIVELAVPRYAVDGNSMQPTLISGERLLVSRLSYLFGQPQRGDILVLHAPDAAADATPLIKRLVGMPRERVEMQRGRLLINGRPLTEPYVVSVCNQNQCPDHVWQLEAGEYFVMGDNRRNSRDSRDFGPVTQHDFIGEALIRYWPLEDVGIIEKANGR